VSPRANTMNFNILGLFLLYKICFISYIHCCLALEFFYFYFSLTTTQ
jgi:hypothetical protein